MKMKVTIVKCDRCKNTVRDDEPLFKLAIYEGKKRKEWDLCGGCRELTTRLLDGANLTKPGRVAKTETDLVQRQLEAARRVANRAIEAYADGATADQLRGALVDVVSAANRG